MENPQTIGKTPQHITGKPRCAVTSRKKTNKNKNMVTRTVRAVRLEHGRLKNPVFLEFFTSGNWHQVRRNFFLFKSTHYAYTPIDKRGPKSVHSQKLLFCFSFEVAAIFSSASINLLCTTYFFLPSFFPLLRPFTLRVNHMFDHQLFLSIIFC